MKLDNLFVGTSMETDVLSFYASHETTWIKHSYTPHRIYLWNRGQHSKEIYERLAMHELCHIIDFYINDRNRLLTNDFGYKPEVIYDWSKGMLVHETRVIAMQKTLCSHLAAFERYRVEVSSTDVFYDSLDVEKFMTMEEYFDLVWSFQQEFQGPELVYAFKCAMQYIKSNR